MTDEIKRSLSNRIDARGRRRIKLRNDERVQLRKNEQIEKAVALFLDLENGHTWEEIAGQLGVSVITLKKITKSKEFEEVYDRHFSELGHDPRLRATQAAMVDLLPAAYTALKTLITGASTSDTVRLNAVKEIFRLNGIHPNQNVQEDRQDLAKFLQNAASIKQTNIENVNIEIPPEYDKNIQNYLEGNFEEIDEAKD